MISHNKMLVWPVDKFLVIKTVDQSNKTYLFILKQRPSKMRTEVAPLVEPTIYRTRLLEKLKKVKNTIMYPDGIGCCPWQRSDSLWLLIH